MANSSLNLIDVFSGVGGLTLGFCSLESNEKPKVSPRLLVDIDPVAKRVCQRNMPNVNFHVGDVHELSGNDLRTLAGIATNEELHFLVGGPPCQGFSGLGKKVLDDPRNSLVVDYLRLVKELRPLVAIMENVPQIITSHQGAVNHEIQENLAKFGYTTSSCVLYANEYGVPQLRKRAIVIAYRHDMGIAPQMPVATHERIVVSKAFSLGADRVRFDETKLPYVSVEEAIGDLPLLKAGEGEEFQMYPTVSPSPFQLWARDSCPAVFNHRTRTHSSQYLKKLSVIEEGGANKYLPVELRFSDNYFSQAYARLGRHAIAYTITTSFANPGSGRFIHYRDLRSITVREAARLQSFPDWFVFDGNIADQMRHVGNAVPPLLALAIQHQVVSDVTIHLEKKIAILERDQRSNTMRAVPSKNSTAEILLQQALKRTGKRSFLTHSDSVPGHPDIVFRRARLAVFVDGCFWHGCPKCYRRPSSNAVYWQQKVARNKNRDRQVVLECKKAGWRVLRFWEHEILKDASRAALKVIEWIDR